MYLTGSILCGIQLTLSEEVRFKIYGYLFLDPPHAFLDADQYKEGKFILADEEMCYIGYYNGHYLDDDMINMYDPEYGEAMGDICDGMFHAVYNGTGVGADKIDDFSDRYNALNFNLSDESSSESIHDDCSSAGNEGESDGKSTCSAATSNIKELPKRVVNEVVTVKRHLSILRVSRQIYSEASTLLCSNLTVIVGPGDALIDTPGNEIVSPTQKIWRHAPCKPLEFTNTDGKLAYGATSLPGPVDPHVFSRFEKILYDAEFTFGLDTEAPKIHVHNDRSVRAEDAAKFATYLFTNHSTRRFEDPLPGRLFEDSGLSDIGDVFDCFAESSAILTPPSTADVIQKFVDLLSRSPLIRHLEVMLTVSVERGTYVEDIPYDFSDTDSEQDRKTEVMDDAADHAATGLFLESGVLHPLRKLANVKRFSLKPCLLRHDVKLEKKHSNLIEDLKMAIEKNWVVKHGSQ